MHHSSYDTVFGPTSTHTYDFLEPSTVSFSLQYLHTSRYNRSSSWCRLSLTVLSVQVASEVLGLPEVGQDGAVVPACVAQLGPVVVVAAVPAGVEHPIDGRRPANHSTLQ